MTETVAADEQYLLVEEVADRLGLPLAVLLRRVEAGDIPARRIENENGVHYSLRLADLGIEPMTISLPEEEETNGNGHGAQLFNGATPSQDEARPDAAGSAEFADADAAGTVDLTGRRVGDEPLPEDLREPAQPAPTATAPWLHAGIDATEDPGEVRGPGASAPAAPLIERQPAAATLLTGASTPHGDLAAMSLDARELVAGLLDRWERTLEQRIYTEQRQRFQGELAARQNMVKQLQMELHTARAEHAAAQAEKDRFLAEKERELADRERELSDARRLAGENERLSNPAAAARRRRWFWQRTDV